MRVVSWHIIFYFLIGISSYDCQSTSICAKLDRPDCRDQSLNLCGCFDLVLMRGGFARGDYDPHEENIYEAILIRQDSSLEYYRHDTLLWRSSFVIVRKPGGEKGKAASELQLVDRDMHIGVEDADHLWTGEPFPDAFHFLFVRQR